MRFLPALLVPLLLAAPLAAGGEDATSFYTSGTWEGAQHAAAKSKLVVLGKVVEAGKAKGKGWDGKPNSSSTNYMLRTGKVDVRQEIVVEVTEVLRGKLATKRLTVRIESAELNYQAMYQFSWAQLRKKKLKRGKRGLTVNYFTLAKGKTYLLFLDAPKVTRAAKPGGKDKTVAGHLKTSAPMEAPDPRILDSVRGFCDELARWDKPPKLAAEEAKEVARLIADLGADDYAKRDKADRTLRVIGAGLRPQLKKASEDGDEERAFRAREILEAVKPEPGKVEMPKGRGKGKLPGIFKKRPKPKPEPKPGPGPEPDPETKVNPEARPPEPAPVPEGGAGGG